MEPEGSIPNSKELSTCPYPEPDLSSIYHPIQPVQDPSYYFPPIYVLIFLVVSFPLAFPPTIISDMNNLTITALMLLYVSKRPNIMLH
jgi:hypothetical protein